MKALRLLLLVVCLSMIGSLSSSSHAQPPSGHFVTIEMEPQPLDSIQSLVTYPPEAKQQNLRGATLIRMLIDTTGKVTKVVIDRSSGHPILDSAAKSAAYNVRFTPAYAEGRKMKVWYSQEVSFDPGTRRAPDTANEPDINEFIDVDQEPVPTQPLKSLVVYPPSAISAKEEGKVYVQALIDTAGNVRRTVIEKSCGFDDLDKAATTAIGHATFTPAIANGRKVMIWYMVAINFRLP